MRNSLVPLFALLAIMLSAGLGNAAVYEVGPGKTYTNIGDVPLESLAPGDTVKIHYRSTPYAEKFCLSPNGSLSNPLTIQGVADASGNLPVLEAIDAVTRTALDYTGDERSIISIGGTATPNNQTARGVIIENIIFRNARQPYTYTCDAGTLKSYVASAAAIRIIDADGVIVRNCVLTNCGNGLITSPTTLDLTIESCYIYGNGIVSDISVHNVYSETRGITVQYTHFGPLLSGAGGNNFKDRSAGTVFRYNWVEDGARQLDLVDSSSSAAIRGDARYGKDFVYGNVLYEKNAVGSNQIVHYGGDSGTKTYYRPGPLQFYNNTVVSNLTGNTALFRPQDDEVIECFNNVVHTPNGSLQINAVTNGSVTYYYNWLQSGYSGTGATNGGNNITGTSPGFVDLSGDDFRLAAGSACIDAGMALPSACSSYPVDRQYVKHHSSEARPSDGTLDIGAFEYSSGPAALVITTASLPDGTVSSAYSQTLAATGGVTPYAWSVISGSLPSGLSLASSTGVISGTPTSAGTSYFTVQVADSQSPADTDSKALAITINSIAGVDITMTSLPDGMVSSAYSQTLAATGGVTPYTWSVISGSLPAGLSLASSTGVISGTPTTQGTSNFTVRVADSQNPASTDDQALSIKIDPAPSGPTYEMAASDTSSNTKTTWVTKVSLTFTPAAADEWLILAFAEISGSSTGVSTMARFKINGAVEGEIWKRPAASTDWSPVVASKVMNLAAQQHTMLLEFASGANTGTAYMRNARIVAIRKSALEMASAAADSEAGVTDTMTAYATLSFTPASAGDYLLIYTAENRAPAASQQTTRATLNGSTLDEGLISMRRTDDYFPWASFAIASCGTSQQTMTISAQRPSGTSGHLIRRARLTAIRLTGGRFAEGVSAVSDGTSTTTSTSYQEKVTRSWSTGSPNKWLIMSSARFQESGTDSVKARTQLDNTTTMAEQMRKPNMTSDWMDYASIDVRDVNDSSRYVDVDYCTSNSSNTAGIKYAHLVAVPLD